LDIVANRSDFFTQNVQKAFAEWAPALGRQGELAAPDSLAGLKRAASQHGGTRKGRKGQGGEMRDHPLTSSSWIRHCKVVCNGFY